MRRPNNYVLEREHNPRLKAYGHMSDHVVGTRIGPRRQKTGTDSYYSNELPELKNFSPKPRPSNTDPSGLASYASRPIWPRIKEGFGDVRRTVKNFVHAVESGRITGGIEKWWTGPEDRKIQAGTGVAAPVPSKLAQTLPVNRQGRGKKIGPRVESASTRQSSPWPISTRKVGRKGTVSVSSGPATLAAPKRQGKKVPSQAALSHRSLPKKSRGQSRAGRQERRVSVKKSGLSRGRQNALLIGAGLAAGFVGGRLSKRQNKANTVYSGSYVRNYYYR